MLYRWMFIYLYLFIILHEIVSHESPLQCWRCEVTAQASGKAGVFLDDCRARFDFTQHTREECDGKCWKSVDLIETRTFENNTIDSLLRRDADLFKLRSSRRCFSATELLRAAELGVNTSDGCRQVRRDDKKMKEVCFCSDQDMCNYGIKITTHFFFLFIFSLISFVFKTNNIL